MSDKTPKRPGSKATSTVKQKRAAKKAKKEIAGERVRRANA
jgi:hypothetical protein